MSRQRTPRAPAEVSTLIDEWYSANERADGSVLDLYLPSGYHLYGDERIDYSEIPGHLGGNPDFQHEWITEPMLITAYYDGSYVVVRGMRNILEHGVGMIPPPAFEIETTDDGLRSWLRPHGSIGRIEKGRLSLRT